VRGFLITVENKQPVEVDLCLQHSAALDEAVKVGRRRVQRRKGRKATDAMDEALQAETTE
jgi:hypothetical protein